MDKKEKMGKRKKIEQKLENMKKSGTMKQCEKNENGEKNPKKN